MTAVRSFLLSARLRALLSLGMVLGLGAVGTLAAWSTSTTTTSGVFTTASVDIQLNGNQGNPTAYPITVTPTLLPGQSAASLLSVQNTGSLAFNYTASAVGVGTVGQALQLTARAGATVVNNACSGGTVLTASPGALTSSLSFGTARGPVAARTGADPLCLQFTLPSTVPNTMQGQTGNVTLTFQATTP